MRSLELKLNIAAGCLCFYKRKVILRLINNFRKSICIIFSFNTQDLPENHFGELEPPIKILLIIIIVIVIVIIIIIIINLLRLILMKL